MTIESTNIPVELPALRALVEDAHIKRCNSSGDLVTAEWTDGSVAVIGYANGKWNFASHSEEGGSE